MKNKTEEKLRVQLEFSKVRAGRIKSLMEQTGSETYKDLFNNALGLFDWAVEQVQGGRVITALDQEQNQYRELNMPALQHAAQFQPEHANAGLGGGI